MLSLQLAGLTRLTFRARDRGPIIAHGAPADDFVGRRLHCWASAARI